MGNIFEGHICKKLYKSSAISNNNFGKQLLLIDGLTKAPQLYDKNGFFFVFVSRSEKRVNYIALNYISDIETCLIALSL